jgi:hypothetical protein
MMGSLFQTQYHSIYFYIESVFISISMHLGQEIEGMISVLVQVHFEVTQQSYSVQDALKQDQRCLCLPLQSGFFMTQ